MNTDTIPLELWEPKLNDDGTPTGTLRRVRYRTSMEVLADVKAKAADVLTDCEYVALWHGQNDPNAEIPAHYRVVVYAMTGGSEGHYAHVDLYTQEDDGNGRYVTKVWGLLFVKTFMGMEHARVIANRLADLMEV